MKAMRFLPGAQSVSKKYIIYLKASNGNEVSLAVGGDEAVLGFAYSHNNPPYYASKGASTMEEPAFTGYIDLEHPTKYPRYNVISFAHCKHVPAL